MGHGLLTIDEGSSTGQGTTALAHHVGSPDNDVPSAGGDANAVNPGGNGDTMLNA
jgi:hypothetical protein